MNNAPFQSGHLGFIHNADIQAEAVQLGMDGTQCIVNSPLGRMTIASHLVGEHNVSNLLAAIGIGLEMGMSHSWR